MMKLGRHRVNQDAVEILRQIGYEREKLRPVEDSDPVKFGIYNENALSWAGLSYAVPRNSPVRQDIEGKPIIPYTWPYRPMFWRPGKSRRQELVKAAAFLVAEIERIDKGE